MNSENKENEIPTFDFKALISAFNHEQTETVNQIQASLKSNVPQKKTANLKSVQPGPLDTKKMFTLTIKNLQKALETEQKASSVNEKTDQLEIAKLQKMKADLNYRLAQTKEKAIARESERDAVLEIFSCKNNEFAAIKDKTEAIKQETVEKKSHLTELKDKYAIMLKQKEEMMA